MFAKGIGGRLLMEVNLLVAWSDREPRLNRPMPAHPSRRRALRTYGHNIIRTKMTLRDYVYSFYWHQNERNVTVKK